MEMIIVWKRITPYRYVHADFYVEIRYYISLKKKISFTQKVINCQAHGCNIILSNCVDQIDSKYIFNRIQNGNFDFITLDKLGFFYVKKIRHTFNVGSGAVRRWIFLFLHGEGEGNTPSIHYNVLCVPLLWDPLFPSPVWYPRARA